MTLVPPDDQIHAGLMAWRLGLLGREDLQEAFAAPAQGRAPVDWLGGAGALAPTKRAALLHLIDQHLSFHDGNVAVAIAALMRTEAHGVDAVPTPAGPPGAPLRARLATIATRHQGDFSTIRHEAAVATRPVAARPGRDGDGDGKEGPGRYRIIRPLARGGLGEVFVALDTQLRREVALKELQAKHADDPASRARFLLEAEITGSLDHPGVVPIYSLGTHPDGRLYYTMRLITGDTLHDAIARHHHPGAHPGRTAHDGLLELRHLLGSLIDACNTMEFAHRRGIIHRDLKPGNIMIGQYGETLIMDWGLAKPIGAREEAPGRVPSIEMASRPGTASLPPTAAGAMMGTPAYMSPEQASGHPDAAGTLSDVYGLGATLYTILTGRAPYPTIEPTEWLPRLARGEFDAPRAVNPRIPAPLEAICLKAMARRPEDRYATPRGLGTDLENWLAGEPVSALREAGVKALLSRLLRRANALNQTVLLRHAQKRERVQSRHAEALRREADRLVVQNAMERGLNHCEQGDLAAGLLWLARGLDRCDRHNDPALEAALRTQLAAWMGVLAVCRVELVHDDWVNAVRFTPDGEHVLTASADGRARLWSARDGAPAGPPLEHPDRILAATIHPDGRHAATACADATVRTWDTRTGQQVGPNLSHPQRVHALAFHPEGDLLATAGVDGRARLWDWRTGTRREYAEVRHRDWINAIAFHPDGLAFLTGSGDRTAQLWASPGQPAPAMPPLEHADFVTAVAFSGDGQVMATGGQDRAVRLWSARNGQPQGPPMWHNDSVHAVALSRDGSIVASAGRDAVAILWDATSGAMLAPPIGHSDWVKDLDLSPDGKRLATACVDRRARIWELPPAVRAGRRHPHGGWVNAVALAPDGLSFLTGAGDGRARRFDVATGNPLGPDWEHPDRVYAVAFHPTRPLAVTGCKDGQARIWDLDQGQPVGDPLSCLDRINAIAFSPDGGLMAVASDDGTVRLWDLATHKPFADPVLHPCRVNDVAIDPRGRHLVSAGMDGIIRRWSLPDLAPRGEIATGGGLVQALALHPDGNSVASCGKDRFVRLWTLDGGDPIGSPLPHPDRVLCLAYTQDGARLATGGRDQHARLWDLASSKPLGPPWPHADWVNALDVSRDGRSVLTGSTDGSARLWTLPEPLERPASPGQSASLIAQLTGRFLTPTGALLAHPAGH